jgi:heptosyltransferase-2
VKILIIGPDSLTELVLVEALVAQLHKRHHCDIDLLIPENLHPLVARLPKVGSIFALPQSESSFGLTQACVKLGLDFRHQGYYQAINLQPQLPYSFIPFIARIARRTVSYSDKLRFLFHYSLANDRRYRAKNTYGRQLDHLLSLANEPASTLPEKVRPELVSHDAERQALLAQRQLEAGEKPLLIICPGVDGAVSKHWPASHFAELAKERIKAGWQVWLMGDNESALIAAEIEHVIEAKQGDGLNNLAGQLSLVESVDLLSLADAVLGLDNGFMHMACALNRPVVALYGPTSPRYRPPLTKHFQVLTQGLGCNPCEKTVCPRGLGLCLNYLRPALVLDALAKLPQPLEMSY